jgi:predicted hydrocarbon binding protein/predicted amino acid-binding ACT domain protein
VEKVFSEFPKRTFSMEEVKPGEKLYEVCIILKDVRGAIAEAAKVLADANVNIKTGALFYIPGKQELGTWTSFIDISKATLSIQDLKKKLQGLDEVADVRFEEPKPAPYEVIHFPVLHGNLRALIMGADTFAALWEGFEGILTPSGLEAVLYNVGKKIGTYTAMGLKDRYGLEDKDLILAVVQAAKALGWGIVEFQDIDFKSLSGTIIMKESFEALARQKKSYKVCHWARGYFAGCMSVVFGKPVEAVEVKCLATGAEHCEFKIRWKI